MQLLPTWSKARHALVTLAEVDDPRKYVVKEFIGDPSARLSFYERLGAEVLDLPYFQPRLTESGKRAPGMLLLAFKVQPDALVPGPVRALRGDIVGGFLRQYFIEAEGSAETEGDPDLARLLGQASSEEGVRLLPVARYSDIEPDNSRA